MKLRSLVLFGAGVLAGLTIARRMTEDDPAVLHGAPEDRNAANPALRLVTGQAQRLADRASVKSLGAIRKARGAIRERLGEDPSDAAWN